jgi:ribosome-binding factor A
MESTRQKKISRMIQKEMASIFQQESRNLFGGKMISVTVVHVSPDLSVAKIYLSIFPEKDKMEFLETIKQKSKILRNELGKRIRFQVKSIPELAFFIDDSLDYIKHIEDILNDK